MTSRRSVEGSTPRERVTWRRRVHTTATIMASPRTAASTGEYLELSELTGLKTFITNFAGHIAAEAARDA